MRETTILIIPIIQDANHMTDREHLLKKNDDMIHKVLCMMSSYQCHQSQISEILLLFYLL
jgi:hypothetical protein